MLFKRFPGNPVLRPDPGHAWENFAAFNGTVTKKNGHYLLLYRAAGDPVAVDTKKLRLSVIGRADSLDGYNFSNRKIFLSPELEWEKYGCEDPRVTLIDGQYFIFYTALSNFPPNYMNIKIGVALSKDLETVEEKHLVTPFNAKAMTMFPEKINGKYTVMLTVNTDNPPSNIAYAQFDKIETLWDMNFWNDWYKDLDRYIIPLRRVNSDNMEVGATPIATRDGWVVVYSYIKHYFSSRIKKEFRIDAVLLDLENPQKIIGRIFEPLLIPEEPYEKNGIVPDIVFPEGALIEGDKIRIYYGAADTACAVAEANTDEFMRSFELNSPGTLKCQKFPHNPLLEPIAEHAWEAKAVFNPAACELEGKTYIIYRSTSDDDLSYLGLAISHDGLLIDERLKDPIYPFSGCEDPRVTIIDDRLYMLYTAFDGRLPRLAFTSIAAADFLARKWQSWEKVKIISPPEVADKDGMLFPEKVGGKYVIFHRIEPNICIDYVDDLNFDNSLSLKTTATITPHNRSWDELKIGINTPPLKTDQGWVIFYHGISRVDQHYRIGVLLLDLEDVTRVIGWTPYPILEPETIFEKRGVVNNVVFPCGYVIKGDIIYLYYGGADKVVCGATVSLKALLEYVIKSRSMKYLSYP